MNTRVTEILFTEWTPDAPYLSSSLVEVFEGVPAVGGGYAAVRGHHTTLSNMPATSPCGHGNGISDSTRYFFLGSNKTIHQHSAGTSTNVSKGGTAPYSTGTSSLAGRWEFVQFGNDMLATNYVDPIQKLTLGATSFSDLSAATTTPKVRTITASRNFVVAGNTYETISGTSPYRVQWSAIGDATDWEVSAETQADYTDLDVSGGTVQRVFGGEYVVIFQERAISRMTYVGPPVVWQIDQVSPEIGLVARGAAAQIDNKIFFLSERGFHVLVNGSQIFNIGDNKVDKYFFDEMYGPHRHSILCAIEPHASRVWWSYPPSTIATSRRAIIYDFSLDKWGASWTGSVGSTGAYTYIGDYLDDDGERLLVVSKDNDSLGEVGLLDGNGRNDIDVYTGLIQLTPGRRSMVKSIRLLLSDSLAGESGVGWSEITGFNGGTIKVEAVDQPYATSPTQVSINASLSSSNRHSLRVSGKWHQIQLLLNGISSTGVGTYTNRAAVVGVEVEYVPTHWR